MLITPTPSSNVFPTKPTERCEIALVDASHGASFREFSLRLMATPDLHVWVLGLVLTGPVEDALPMNELLVLGVLRNVKARL